MIAPSLLGNRPAPVDTLSASVVATDPASPPPATAGRSRVLLNRPARIAQTIKFSNQTNVPALSCFRSRSTLEQTNQPAQQRAAAGTPQDGRGRFAGRVLLLGKNAALL